MLEHKVVDVKASIVRHLIPFKFKILDSHKFDNGEQKLLDIIECFKLKKTSQISNRYCDYPKGNNSEVYDFLKDLIVMDADLLLADGHNRDVLSKAIGIQLINKCNQTQIRFSDSYKSIVRIANYQLFLFKTGIGFLSLTLEFENIQTLSEFVDINSKIKSISHSRLPKETDPTYNSFYVEQTPKSKFKGDVTEPVKYSYIDWISNQLEYIEEIEFFNKSKALVFTTIAIESELNQKFSDDLKLKKQIVRMSRGYDSKYEVSLDSHRDSDTHYDDNSIFSPYDNVHWAFAREGVSNLLTIDDTHSSKDFLLGGYIERVQQNYIYLYLLTLHQYYGLIHLNTQIGKLPSFMNAYTDQSKHNKVLCEKNYKQLMQLNDQVYFFYFKCIFEEVSHITHQSQFYKRIKNALGISSMMKEIDFEMSKISDLVKMIRNEEIKIIETNKKKKLDFITTGGGVLALITTYSIIENKAVMLFVKMLELLPIKAFKNINTDNFGELDKLLITTATLIVAYLLAFLLKFTKNFINTK